MTNEQAKRIIKRVLADELQARLAVAFSESPWRKDVHNVRVNWQPGDKTIDVFVRPEHGMSQLFTVVVKEVR